MRLMSVEFYTNHQPQKQFSENTLGFVSLYRLLFQLFILESP